ncbi:P-loop containing nucleoside triphosphate hydrolase protein [Sporormia fimetaria CBS 119925]|uniref:P-loop containing nucleoside triphosphate hydrolase protein n=1 Tax=Sporormia fimetaria CBS 119925 TaxID=1340428 RepID=A0A6A6UYU9_9PLEO|nr:P-loop containing nucleoside triphosphate hydrolase protein [Sporormia fimetaria CBS 119925]
MSDTTLGSSGSSSESDFTLEPVAKSYARLFSRRVDIVGDYAGNELFLVEGDSLLLHCFDDAHIDFDPGFQLLHAAYAVENFLRGLIVRRCNFHIAFFGTHRELCVPHWANGVRDKYLLARAAIIRHLRVNLQAAHPEVEVHSFPSVRSPGFARYVESTDLYFIMCHDGATSDAQRRRNVLAKRRGSEANGDEEDAEVDLRVKGMLRLLIYWFLDQGHNVALVNGLEFRDTKVVTTVVESTRHARHDEWANMVPGADSIALEDRTSSSNQDRLAKIKSICDSPLTERECLAVLLIADHIDKNELDKYASAFLRHAALLSEIPLKNRSLEATSVSEEAQTFLDGFVNDARQILESAIWAEDVASTGAPCDIADLVDGHLFAACLEDPACGTGSRCDLLFRAVAGLIGGEVAAPATVSQTTKKSRAPPAVKEQRPYAVLPFSNEVFEKHLAPIHLAVDQSEEVLDSRTDMIFREVSHWHNSKRPVDPKLREDQALKTAKQQFWARRRNQWFMAEMMAYAASLTNAVGKSLEPEIITTGAKAPSALPAPDKKEDNARPKQAPKGGKKGTVSKKQAMMAEIAASKSRKDEDKADKVLAGWRLTCTTLDKEQLPALKYSKTKQYLVTLNTPLKRDTLEAEVRLFMLNTLLSIWIDECRRDRKEQNLHVAAMIFDSISSFSRLKLTTTKTITNCLTTTLKALKLPQVEIPAGENDRNLAFNFALRSSPTVDISVPLTPKQFQLAHCGPYFDRNMDSAPDARVPFEPDAWQRKVLDEIDAKRSLLVVAPTSAGKTFISFYAMKQVLEANNDDILVYVAPTKALVNQIAAEVQARFSKTYKYGGNSVWGIHTRDYRINNPTGCQILVTVPHILQIMLLAPSNAKSWSERVKWIIFDEVHCLGQAEDGLIWEQLLLLAPCPIIALSATIGNPKEFSDWLTSTQRAIGNDLRMVSHPHRYSDLRKFLYTAPKSFKFEGLPERRGFAQLGLDGRRDFTFIHPVAALNHRSRGIPDDFGLEARDCFTLWQSMAKHSTPEYPIDKALDPSVALPSVIKKIDIINWEAKLKAVLREWLADVTSPFQKVYNDINADLHKVEAGTDLESKKAETAVDEEEDVDANKLDGILPLLTSLHEQDALPGIIFNYDRGLCEKMCKTLMEHLVSAETAWKETSPKWKSMLATHEMWKKAMAKADKRKPPKVPKKSGKGDDEVLTKADLARETAEGEASPWASFDPENPVDGFHFADHKKLTQDDLAKHMKELIRREVPEWLLNGLRRGIGVHHAGMNRKYRQVVEILFRKGYLRVVIATGTLALGINMPCKTVVFSGDSVFLTALNYRQAAGRAGRRGFDMLGNVVFHGISTNKIRRLLSSRLPDLNGHFPITTTLVLRLFTLLHDSKNSPFAIRSINALLSQPRLYLGGEESKMTVLHHLRFSIEYLRRQYLLDSRGAPLNLAGCVSHLYFTENSSFAFHTLLKDGYFHKLCADIDKNPEKVLRELMLCMAHLFGRMQCRQADQDYIEEVVKKSPSIVFLPPLPETAAGVLRAHNQSTLDIFRAYVQTFVEQHVKQSDVALPLTGVKIGGDALPDTAQALPIRPPTKVRSPFVALSGYDDTFDTIHDLCTTARSGVFLEEAVVPHVGLYPEESDMPLNAYLYDFFMHGDVTALANANRVRAGDVWFVLNDFSLVLATIVTSLSNFMNLTSESDLSFTDVRGEGDEEEEQQEDKYLPPEDSGYETGSTTSMANQRADQQQQKKLPVQVKKKKVADSWDDDADEEDFQAELAAEKEKKRKEAEAKLRDQPAWEEGEGLMNVLKSFKMLREEFDLKFRAMWA